MEGRALADRYLNYGHVPEKRLTMAYTTLSDLTTMASGKKLDLCSAAEYSAPAPFYPEDIFRVMGQRNYDSIDKRMATFWGERHPVWVGFDSAGNVLEAVIALRCPPYYPPDTFPEVKETEADKPSGFPNS